MAEKPRLALAGGSKKITVADVARLFKSVTGRDATPEALKNTQKKLDAAYAKYEVSQSDTTEPAQPIARPKTKMTEAGLAMVLIEDAEQGDE